jgi:hypothetical protein
LNLTGRLILDLLMALCILFSLAYRITGDAAHEWIGFSAFGLFVIHNLIHWSWYQHIFKGRYNFRRTLNTVVNILLLATGAMLITSGLLHSRTIFSFMHFSGGMLLRQAHTFAAYWGLLLVSIHIGLHGEMILTYIVKAMKNADISRLPLIIPRGVAALIFIYGLDSFFERDMPAKLFLGYSFDFWDENKNTAIFYTNNISIMAVYIFITHYFVKFMNHIQSNKIA